VARIKIAGIGEWDIPEHFTFEDAQTVKRVTKGSGGGGLRMGEFFEALNAGDADALLAMTIVSASRELSPRALTELEQQLLGMDVGVVEVIADDDQAEEEPAVLPPASAADEAAA
jgi:hypothetical protein